MVVLRKKLICASRRDSLEPVLMVEAAKNGSASNLVTLRNTVSKIVLECGRMQGRGYSRTKTHVWSRVVEMGNPGLENELEMPLIEWNEKVQTFTA
jgi:hypothetical protein